MASTKGLTIGRDGTTGTEYANGLIDEVRIYDRALSAEEISDLCNNYGYTTTAYPGRVLVRKYTSPEPTTVVGGEQGPPTLLSPANGAITNDNTPTFSWENSGVADNYELWVDNDPGFSSPEIKENTTENSYTPAGLGDENYSWRVRAYFGGTASIFSETWTLL